MVNGPAAPHAHASCWCWICRSFFFFAPIPTVLTNTPAASQILHVLSDAAVTICVLSGAHATPYMEEECAFSGFFFGDRDAKYIHIKKILH